MTNKEFYGDKLLAITLEDNCHELHIAVYDESCLGRKKCEDCRFSSIENIENWLNAEHVEPEPEPEPPLLENGDGLKPGDWIMVRDCDREKWRKRQFLFYYNGIFYCEYVDNSIGNGEYVLWKQARLPEDGEE